MGAQGYTQIPCNPSLDRIYLINLSLHLVSNNFNQSCLFKAAFNINSKCIITREKRYIKRQQRAKDLAVLTDQCL